MLTTLRQMQFKAPGSKPVELIPHISPINMMEYMNVYLDKDGKRHYSSEEFKIDEDGLFSFSDALQDAYTLSVLGNWEYVRTLASETPSAITERMERHLEELTKYAAYLRDVGDEPSAHWEEVEQQAEQTRMDNGQFGVRA